MVKSVANTKVADSTQMKLSFILVLSLDSELFDHFSGFETEFDQIYMWMTDGNLIATLLV